MTKNVPTSKENNNAKNAIAVIVLAVWVASIILRVFNGESLPFSVEIGFLVILGYVFGSKAFDILKDIWRRK